MRSHSALTLLLIIAVVPGRSQELPHATIRVEVKADASPVVAAKVTVNGVSVQTDISGIAIAASAFGTAMVASNAGNVARRDRRSQT